MELLRSRASGAVLLLLIIGGVFFAASFCLAQSSASDEDAYEPCKCYCYTKEGAEEFASSAPNISYCKSLCSGLSGVHYLGCYTEAQEGLWPENNTMCWTQYACEEDKVAVLQEDGTYEDVPSVWSEQQPPECLAGEHYCFNPEEPITLNIAFGQGGEQVGSIGEYVLLIYQWLIPAAGLLAVVMIMIGGVQYALARGKQGAIKQARDRIGSAILGLILVLGAYTIAATIDPDLVYFEHIGVPKIRRVTFIDPNRRCEYLERQGIIVEKLDAGEDCGDRGKVTGYEEGAESSTIEVGHECVFGGCADPAASCTADPLLDNGYGCVRCSEAAEQGLTPSVENCANLVVPGGDESSGPDVKKSYCLFDSTAGNQCYEIVYPASGNYLDCARLRADAAIAGSPSCRAYDIVVARGSGLVLSDYTIDAFSSNGHWVVEDICNNDPCQLGRATGGCQMIDWKTLEAATIGSYCENLSILTSIPGLSSLCNAADQIYSPVGCYDAEYAAQWEQNYRLQAEINELSTLGNMITGSNDDKIEALRSQTDESVPCLDYTGQSTSCMVKW